MDYVLMSLFYLELMIVMIMVPTIVAAHLRCVVHDRGYEVSYVDVVTAACIVHIMIQMGQ